MKVIRGLTAPSHKTTKVIVFDLDETLGSFGDLYILWTGIKHLYTSFSQFDKLMELYPEFLRNGILTILEYLYDQKRKERYSKLIIYTNNQCSKEWVQLIAQYFQRKIHGRLPKGDLQLPLFHKLIYAFKIKHRQVDLFRTTHRKTYTDFIKCANLTQPTEICFVDDMLHNDMIHDYVYYICPEPYLHSLSRQEIITRFVEQKWYLKQKSLLFYSTSFWKQWFYLQKKSRPCHMSPTEMLLSAQELYRHVKVFLAYSEQTRKRKCRSNATRKKKTEL